MLIAFYLFLYKSVVFHSYLTFLHFFLNPLSLSFHKTTNNVIKRVYTVATFKALAPSRYHCALTEKTVKTTR